MKKGCSAICPEGVWVFDGAEMTVNSCLGRVSHHREGESVRPLQLRGAATLTPFSFVLANTEALHDKINVLANRVRSLEDALAQSHALNSHEPHHLLNEELLQIKRPLERERDDNSPKEPTESGESIDALGSL